MIKLKGSGNTFSTSNKPWQPFRYNKKLTAKMARLHRLVEQGKTGGATKEELRSLAQQALQDFTVK